MDLNVLDNLFTDKFLMDLNIIMKQDISWKYKNTANRKYPYDCPSTEGTHLFFGDNVYDLKDGINFYNNCPDKIFDAFHHIVKKIRLQDNVKYNSMALRSIDLNLQVYGQDGTEHIDHFYGDDTCKDLTIMFYPHYQWKEEWGGHLEIMKDGQPVERYLPIPGRVIIFDATVPHRALAPSVKNIGRYSIAYRLSEQIC